MHVIPSGKSNALVKIVKQPKPRLASDSEPTGWADGQSNNSETAEGGLGGKENQSRRNFAKVYPAWQGYSIDFKLQKVYRPVATQRIGYPPEQSEEIRQTRRAIWEKLVPNSSSLALDLLEGLQINTQTLDEVRDILAGKWNRTTNNFENRWEWFRRRLHDLGFEEIQIRLLLGCEPAGEPINPDAATKHLPDNPAGEPDSSFPVPCRLRRHCSGDAKTEPPTHNWTRPSALARFILGSKVDDYRWFMEVIRGMWPGPYFRERPNPDAERRHYLVEMGLSTEQIEALYCVRLDQMWTLPARLRKTGINFRGGVPE